MSGQTSDRAILRSMQKLSSSISDDLRRQREDAGISVRSLARAAGVDPSYLARIELGSARPSIETLVRLALSLGSDLVVRLYPNTGPALRDRHQAAIAEMLLAQSHATWARYAEIAVRQPSRGWIDLGLQSPAQAIFLAVEIQSEIRRLEQLLRWSEEKAASLPSWDGWRQLGSAPSTSRLLVVRRTRATRAVAAEFRRQIRIAYPADPDDALAAIRDGAPWPGASVLWAIRDARGTYRLAARP